MGETLLRRLLVIVLCASSVVAIWIVADRAVSTPDAAYSAVPEANSRSGPNLVPTPASAGPSSHAGRGRSTRESSAGRRTEPIGHRGRLSTQEPVGHQLSTVDPQPAAVRGLRVIQANHDSITIRWNPVQGRALDPAISYYAATLNGIPAGETAGLELTINWFNDDMTGSHFIRVCAVDADGHRGPLSDVLVVDRPTTASPAPGAGTDPDPNSPAPDPSRTPPAPPATPSLGPQDPVSSATPPIAPTTHKTTNPTTKPTTPPTPPAPKPPSSPTTEPTVGAGNQLIGQTSHQSTGDAPN